MRERCLQNYLLQKNQWVLKKLRLSKRIKKQQNIMAHEHNDPLKNAFSYNDQTRTMLALRNEERKLAVEVRENLNNAKVIITAMEGKLDESAEQIDELKKKNEDLKQGIKRKLASLMNETNEKIQKETNEMNEKIQKETNEMNEKIQKFQSELIEQIEKDVEEETDAGIVE